MLRYVVPRLPVAKEALCATCHASHSLHSRPHGLSPSACAQVVAFTCGHSFSSPDLRRTVLPDMLGRLRKRTPLDPQALGLGGRHQGVGQGPPGPMPLTVAMLTEEYQMERVAVRVTLAGLCAAPGLRTPLVMQVYL